MDESIRWWEKESLPALTACSCSALQVLLEQLLRPEDLRQEQLAEATLQAYLLAPCPESRAAALTLLACTQPSCKLLRRLEVSATQPYDPQRVHVSAESRIMGCIADVDNVASACKTPAHARPWLSLQEHLQAANLAKGLEEQACGQLRSFVQNAKQAGAHTSQISMPERGALEFLQF